MSSIMKKLLKPMRKRARREYEIRREILKEQRERGISDPNVIIRQAQYRPIIWQAAADYFEKQTALPSHNECWGCDTGLPGIEGPPGVEQEVRQ